MSLAVALLCLHSWCGEEDEEGNSPCRQGEKKRENAHLKGVLCENGVDLNIKLGQIDLI
jgi:hypothetical protein